MRTRKLYYTFCLLWLLCISLCSSIQLSSQNNCPFIWPLDGGTCGDCVPGGWESILTADIVNGVNWFVCDLAGYGQSPTGGNSVLLYGTNNNSEAITTLVGGLTPGVIYNIGFYWTQAYTACPGGLNFGGGDLVITIDGNEYVFSGAEDWELAEICYTAEDYVAEIHITLETDSPGVILVDSSICEELETCCELKVDVDENVSLCPGDDFQFDGSYSDEQGSVVFEWTSEPESGVDYLDDRFALDPIFQFPATDEFFGESYRFKLTVIDAACERYEDFLLVVGPSEIPEFDISLCEVFEDYEMPTTSLDPYTGTWFGDFDFGDLGGTNQAYTFIIDPGQDNCLEYYEYEYYVAEAEPVTFDLPPTYCALDSETYYIEFISDDGVEGFWDFDGLSPDELSPDFYTWTFTPDSDLHCAYNYEYNFEIVTPDSLTFNIPSTFCIVQDNYILPTVSLEGIQGDWDVNEIDVSTVGTNYQVVFTPEDIEDCYFPYVHTYEVTTSIQNSFTMPLSVCSTAGEYEFSPFSDQGYEGVWNPAVVDFDTLVTSSITSTWEPLPGQSDCLTPSSEVVNIEQAEVLTFNLQDDICKMSPSFSLPTTSLGNTVSGQWNTLFVNPNLLDVGENIFEFTPDGVFCAEQYIYTINVIEEFQPEFNLITGFCASQSQVILPIVSDDGYSGSWTVPVIDPSMAGNAPILSTFIPDVGQALCLDAYTETFEVDLMIDPEFTIQEILCSSDLPFELPLVSDNGVSGMWNIQTLDGNVTDQLVQLNFTPDDQSCYNQADISIEILQLDLIDFDFINVSDCNEDDGTILITNNTQFDFQYSIDDGMTWQDDNVFINLIPNDYKVSVRSNTIQTCIQSFDIRIDEPEQIEISSLEVEDITNCTNNDGLVSVLVNLSDAEYSIDEGNSWQPDNLFDNLSEGSYTIMVRNTLGNACMDTATVEILDFPDTEILMIDSENVTECAIDNGSINVLLAEGQNLEYSINGTDWQEETQFLDLSTSSYTVYARSSDSPDCIDSITLELIGPILPLLVDVVPQNTSDCQASDGSVQIFATGTDLEYSIDAGGTWQDDAILENLTEGLYEILIREKGTQTCFISTDIRINDPEPFVLDDIEVENVTSCFPTVGVINVMATSNFDLEFSIDNGMNWQNDPVFNDLENGEYLILVRPTDFINCVQSKSVNVELLPQEIQLLDVQLNQPSDCISSDASIEFLTDINDLEYSIDNGVNWQSGNIFNNIPDGQYTAIIKKPNTVGCEISYDFIIETPLCPCSDLTVDLNVNHVTCEGMDSGQIEILDINGLFTNEVVEISWSNGIDGYFNPMLSTGWYSYEIQYDQNCVWVDSIFIEDFDPITFGLLSFDKTCTDEGQIEVVDFMGGNGEFNFSIDLQPFQEETIFYNLSPDQYSVYVMDQLGCQEEQIISLNSNLDLTLELGAIDPILINQSTFLNPLINQTTIDSFVWSPERDILNPGELVANVAPRETTEYTLTIYYGECVEIRNIIVDVIDNRKLYVGNILSLSDESNNVLFLQSGDDVDVQIHNFSIYDRWGNKVFEKENVPLNDRTYGWDGFFNGREANIGVYTYFINYTLRGTHYKDAGTLTLIR